jgi:hypothetical protein
MEDDNGTRPLVLLTAASLALLAFSLVAGVVDPRQIAGVPAWVKPAKFAASVAITAATGAWILGQMARARGLARAGRVMATMAALELVIITVQAARGVPSHFNARTPLDGALFTIMGLGITIFWVAQLYVAVRAFRHRFATEARTWGIRLGLGGALVGGALGFAMTQPTPAQRAELAAGRPPAALGAHAVGVPDGGPGLPVTRWSTTGGDLRVPHFWGLHALQALPLAALLLERRRRGARAVLAIGAGWLGLIGVLLIQALRGQPLFAPDGTTLAMAALVVALAGFVAAWGGRRSHSSHPGGRPSDAALFYR